MGGGTPPLTARLVERIAEEGPLPFRDVMDAALYDGQAGFYARGGRAGGRGGDFITSPEVGPLFGAVLARALDAWWDELGRPPAYTVVDAGAGPGTLARAVLAARPACLAEGALRYVAVERSAAQRAAHPVGAESRADPPEGKFEGIVLANELLDNLPFRLLVHDGRWQEAYVDADRGGRLVEVLVPLVDAPPFVLPPSPPHGARAPWQADAAAWLADALARLSRGRVVAIDYASSTAAMALRPWWEWLRTYRAHGRGGHYLQEPGSQDITAEVALDQLAAAVRPPDALRTQAQLLALHGLDGLVEEGRRVWAQRAARPDVAAMRMRSRIAEAEALTDPAGLGGFVAAEWQVPPL